ncbi:hypothetical protein [Aeoliella sp.]|uniref:hypothetical protein n=1 Tax=Aeoliella sp. TaxID=2795800 RepID=UPI003CCC3D5B
MIKLALTKRDIDVKKSMVQQLIKEGIDIQLFEVWQPYTDAWCRANLERINGDSSEWCLSWYLQYPADYFLAAIVFAKDFDDVFACTNCNGEEPGRVERVIWLRTEARSGSVGDVIVPSDGTAPQFITVGGFRDV